MDPTILLDSSFDPDSDLSDPPTDMDMVIFRKRKPTSSTALEEASTTEHSDLESFHSPPSKKSRPLRRQVYSKFEQVPTEASLN